MNAYLAQRIYQHEEFEDYIKGMGDEFVNEIKNYSSEICLTIYNNIYKKTFWCLFKHFEMVKWE